MLRFWYHFSVRQQDQELVGDGHAMGVAVGEIELGLLSRRMLLGEVHFLIGTVERTLIPAMAAAVS